MGGIRHLTGYPDRPPTRVGISLGDSLAALYAVIGTLMAVYSRDVKKSGKGQVVDVALYEAVFSLMESMVPEYDNPFGAKQRARAAVATNALHEVILLRNGRNSIAANPLPGDATQEFVNALLTRPRSEDCRQSVRIALQQNVWRKVSGAL